MLVNEVIHSGTLVALKYSYYWLEVETMNDLIKSMFMKVAVSFVLALSALAFTGGTNASTITWDFRNSPGGLSGNQGHTATFTSTDGIFQTIASGWEGPLGDAAADVFVSIAGVPLNHGLGVKSSLDGQFANQLDNIDIAEWLSFERLPGVAFFTGIEISSGLNDGFTIYGSNTATGMDAILASGTMTQAPKFIFFNSSGFNFIRVTPTSGDAYRISTLYGTPVPEPSTMLLLGSGLAGLGFFRWRRDTSIVSGGVTGSLVTRRTEAGLSLPTTSP